VSEVFAVQQSWILLFVGLLFPSILACSSSNVPGSRTVSSVRETNILRKQIDLGPSFSTRVTSIRFFEGDRSKVAFTSERVYATRFAHPKTKTVYTEIQLDHPRPGTTVYFPIALHFRHNQRTLRIEEFEGRVGPDWTSSHHLIGAGDFRPGKWRLGNYEVDVYVNAQKAATAYFEIF
jgi:hypothetical protein